MIPAAPTCTTLAEAPFGDVVVEAPLPVVVPLPADVLLVEEPPEEAPPLVVAPAVEPPPAPPVGVVAGGGAAVPPEPEGVWPRQPLSPESLTVTAAVWAIAPLLSRRLKPI